MVFRGWRHNLGFYTLLFLNLTPIFQGAVEIVCPQITYLNSPANLTCIGTGKTHSYIQPRGGVLTTCNMSSSECFPDAMVTIPNSSVSVLTLSMVVKSHAGNWACSVGIDESRCLLPVANLPSCTVLTKQSTEETTIRVQHFYCSDSTELHLKAGNLTRLLLNTTHTNTTVGIWETTVNAPTSYGKKMLIYVCASTRWEIACTVSVLKDTVTSSKTSMAVIIGSVVAGIVIVTVIITLILFPMKMNRCKREDQPDNHVYDSTGDGARETNDTSGHEYNALYLTALERETSYYNVKSN